jgi:hypothetical protein
MNVDCDLRCTFKNVLQSQRQTATPSFRDSEVSDSQRRGLAVTVGGSGPRSENS